MSTKTNTAVKTAPKVVHNPKEMSLTDPRRRLSREEWKTMSKEQKAERKANRAKARGPAKARFVKLVLRYASRMERFGKLFENQPEIAKQFGAVNSAQRGIAAEIDELPDTWLPAGRKPQHNLTPGMRVVLTEAKATEVKALLGEEVGECEVLNAVGRRVVVKTVKGGVRMFFEARHVKQVEA